MKGDRGRRDEHPLGLGFDRGLAFCLTRTRLRDSRTPLRVAEQTSRLVACARSTEHRA